MGKIFTTLPIVASGLQEVVLLREGGTGMEREGERGGEREERERHRERFLGF